MSSRNNETSTVGAGLGILAAGAIAIAAFAFAVLAFIAFVFTILSLLAWNRPLTFASWSLEPKDARAFVGRGLIGAGLLPAFILFVDLLLGLSINWSYWQWFVLGGYVGGSIGLELLLLQSGESPPPAAPPVQLPAFTDKKLPPAKPFEFADWDDEERR